LPALSTRPGTGALPAAASEATDLSS
jgi:hypothetical protein